MTLPFAPRRSIIPENAPFTPEQRVWLDGLFAGLLSIDEDVTVLSREQASSLLPGIMDAPAQAPADDTDDAPWHDQTLPLAERMKLADGRPLRRRMMAAMAQQDCGQCGYNRQDYADAVFFKKEERLNLCVPGGKNTARMLKHLYEEMRTPPGAAAPAAAAIRETPTLPAPTVQSKRGRCRDHPVEAMFLSRRCLNKPGSEKETWHIDFDLAQTNLDYTVGDSFGVFPTNDPVLVDTIISAIHAQEDFPIAGRTLREVLIDSVSLSPAPDALFQLISYLTGGERRQKAKALASGEDPDGDAANLDVLAGLEKFLGIRPDPEAFVESLEPLQPRLYSISCSLKANPGRVSTTVDAVRYKVGARTRLGVASTYLAHRVRPGDKVRIYVQKAHAFALPADPAIPIIMIGPGTGVAPLRAFLQERMATGAAGRNWLFFGHQRRSYDFFYEDELIAMRRIGLLNRLTLAWSRDADEKIYVQHRMREVGRDLWAWLADGAHVYVCGDAMHMAKDVERALVDVVASHGARSPAEAIAYVSDLKKHGRYQTDVY